MRLEERTEERDLEKTWRFLTEKKYQELKRVGPGRHIFFKCETYIFFFYSEVWIIINIDF